MNARIRFALILLAGVAGSAAAQPNAAAHAPAIQGFVASTTLIKTARDEARIQPTSLASLCNGSTFTELGHGHGDVADAGYARVHCPHYNQRVDAGTASEL